MQQVSTHIHSRYSDAAFSRSQYLLVSFHRLFPWRMVVLEGDFLLLPSMRQDSVGWDGLSIELHQLSRLGVYEAHRCSRIMRKGDVCALSSLVDFHCVKLKIEGALDVETCDWQQVRLHVFPRGRHERQILAVTSEVHPQHIFASPT